MIMLTNIIILINIITIILVENLAFPADDRQSSQFPSHWSDCQRTDDANGGEKIIDEKIIGEMMISKKG